MLLAYKATDIGLKCRGYQFSADKVNETDKANCAANGFHCAEDPLDCLTYYPSFKNAEFWIVKAFGDVDEDDRDSKISCTKMEFMKKLTLSEFVAEALKYMYRHPTRTQNYHVVKNEAECDNQNNFIIVRGLNPIAAGPKGSVLGFAQEDGFGNIMRIQMLIVDGKTFKEHTFYDINGNEAFRNAEVQTYE